MSAEDRGHAASERITAEDVKSIENDVRRTLALLVAATESLEQARTFLVEAYRRARLVSS